MTRAIGRWIATVAIAAAVMAALTLRGTAPADEPQASAADVSTASTAPVALGGWVGATDDVVLPDRVWRPATPAPTPMPTPAPTLQPTVAPVAAQPPPDAGAGGPLAPRTAPPDWTPPPVPPGDVLITGSLGQTLSGGGITVTASRRPLEPAPSNCADHNELPVGLMWVGFNVTVSWSGFDLPNWGADAPGGGLVTCFFGDQPPLTSGAPFQAWLQVPQDSATTTKVTLGFFPNGASPGYLFEFH